MRSTKNDLDLFDRISRIRKDEDGSIWKGEKGIYIIRHLQNRPVGKKKVPLAKVILNHEFLTGLFQSSRQAVFTGDIKNGKRKRLLLFHVVNAENMEIHIQK